MAKEKSTDVPTEPAPTKKVKTPSGGMGAGPVKDIETHSGDNKVPMSGSGGMGSAVSEDLDD